MLPFWLALSASVALHVGVLLTPGWGLPFDDEQQTALIEATIARPVAVAPQQMAAQPPSPRKQRPPAKPSPPTSMAPQAEMPVEPAAPPPAAPAPEPSAEPAAEPAAESEAAVVEAPPAVLPAPTFASRWPRSGRIVYEVRRGAGGFVVGQSEQRWTHDGQNYHLHAETETTGLAALFHPARVVQDSRGTFDAAGLRPLAFEVQRAGREKDSVRFAPEQGRIFLARGQSVPFVAAAQDLLSLFYQLAALGFDMAEFPLAVTNGRTLTTLAIVPGAELALETPQGARQTRHVRVAGKANEDATEIWVDTETRLPLKIRHRDRKGEVFEQIAITIETEPSQ